MDNLVKLTCSGLSALLLLTFLILAESYAHYVFLCEANFQFNLKNKNALKYLAMTAAPSYKINGYGQFSYLFKTWHT